MKKKFPKKELNEYKEILLNLREDLMQQIRDISEDTLMKSQKEMSGDMSGYSLHLADMATDNYEREFNLGLVSNERKHLLEIEDALKRIEEDDYGFCHSCQKLISKIRLKAVPFSKYCKRCQEKLESETRR
ncbi:MAG: TraR/DksA C4-type zinc finger protein [Candidatus Omnitrophica bacterium]|nr:TraR/DksA C4-type zinc finger protein [Candidatus Omnitrophota bacterium]